MSHLNGGRSRCVRLFSSMDEECSGSISMANFTAYLQARAPSDMSSSGGGASAQSGGSQKALERSDSTHESCDGEGEGRGGEHNASMSNESGGGSSSSPDAGDSDDESLSDHDLVEMESAPEEGESSESVIRASSLEEFHLSNQDIEIGISASPSHAPGAANGTAVASSDGGALDTSTDMDTVDSETSTHQNSCDPPLPPPPPRVTFSTTPAKISPPPSATPTPDRDVSYVAGGLFQCLLLCVC